MISLHLEDNESDEALISREVGPGTPQLVINLKTTKARGATIPQSLLAMVDQVVE
jgi:hypothetical protein